MKMKKTLKVVASLLLVLVTSTFVFAQVSNTNFATAYTLRDDADNFMDVRYFNEVDFSNFFLWANFADEINLGFAKKFDKLYLGAYYYGTLWSGIDSTIITTENSSTVNIQYVGSQWFDLIFGFSGMAIKLDTYFDLGNTSTVLNDNINSTNNSYYIFGLTWGGLSIPAGNATFRPWARIGFDKSDNSTYSKTKVEDTVVETTNKIDNSNWLSITLASDIEWGDKDSFFSIAGLNYTFYVAVGLNGIVEESTNGSTSRAGAQGICNVISPYYRFEYKASDKLKFGGNIGIYSYIETMCSGYEYDTNVSPTGDSNIKVLTSTVIFSDIGLGMQYKIKPNFAMNAGFFALLPTFGYVETVTTDVLNGVTTEVEGGSDSYVPYLSTGFVWNINEHFTLDASMDIDIYPKFFSSILDGSLYLGFKYKK